MSVSDDSMVVSAGFANSSIRLWAVASQKLKSLKAPSELDKIDLESSNLLETLLDDR